MGVRGVKQIASGFLLLSVLTSVAIAADNDATMSKEELIKHDYERLTGMFRLTSGVMDGKPIAEDVREKTILITDHNKFTVSTGTKAGTSDDGTFTIDPTKNPKTVDSTQGSGADNGKVVLGIYEIIDDNHKRACWATTGNGRPTDFISKPGSGWLLQNWERIK